MRSLRPVVLTLITSLTLTGFASAEPTAEEWGRILNLSGRQRMLTQKMTKEALFLTADVKADELREALTKTTNLFETTLTALRDGDAELGLPATDNPRIVKQLDKVQAMYLELKPMFDSVANGAVLGDAELKVLADKNVPLLKEMNKAVKMYERGAKKVLTGDAAAAVVINLAGKQRMLTQKMTKEALLVHLGVARSENLLNLRETTSLFERTLTGLLDGDADLELDGTSDATIRGQLGTVTNLWSKLAPTFNEVLTSNSMSRETLDAVASENVTLLKEMNKAVKMFETASN